MSIKPTDIHRVIVNGISWTIGSPDRKPLRSDYEEYFRQRRMVKEGYGRFVRRPRVSQKQQG